MFEPSIVGYQRSKVFKVKHAVQICLLLAVVFWLLYDSNRWPGENNADDEETSSASSHEGTPGILKLGRKHLQTKIAGGVGGEEGHGEKEKLGNNDEHIRVDVGGGDDEIDGRYQYKADGDEAVVQPDSMGEQDEFGMGKDDDDEAEAEWAEDDQWPRLTHYTRDVASSAVVKHGMTVAAEENQSNKVSGVRSQDGRTPILETGKTAEQKQLRPTTNRALTTTSDLNSLENTDTFESKDADENGEEDDVEEEDNVEEEDWADDDLRASFEYSESSAL